MFRHISGQYHPERIGSGLAVALSVLAAAMMGCTSSAMTEPEPDSNTSQSLTTSARLQAFELIRQDMADDALAQKSARLAEVLYEEPAPVDTFKAAIATTKATASARLLQPDWKPSLKLSYRPVNDDLLLINSDVTRDTASQVDIGERAAEGLFRAAFQKALANGTISGTGLDVDNPRRSKIMQGEGVSGQLPVERVKEYIFTVNRKINGIEVFDAGVEISVHRNGRLARIKAFGPSVVSSLGLNGAERVTGQGYEFAQTVTHEQTEARVRAEYPNAQVKALGLRYWLPEPGVKDVVAPREMYFVVPTAFIEGQTAYGRGFFVAYSVKDAKEDTLLWPRADPNAKGDPRP